MMIRVLYYKMASRTGLVVPIIKIIDFLFVCWILVYNFTCGWCHCFKSLWISKASGCCGIMSGLKQKVPKVLLMEGQL